LLCTLPDFPTGTLDALRSMQEPSLPCAWSAASAAWHIEPRAAVIGYLWTWAENQVLVAMKAVPIGQSAGQRVLFVVGSRIAALAAELDPDAMSAGEIAQRPRWSNFCPGLAISSSQHETQYSRLFRS
jgi:urease accessory protein